MTRETYMEAQTLLENISNIERTLSQIERISLIDPNKQKRRGNVLLKLLNLETSANKEEKKAGAYLFDGISIYGVEIPVDEDLLVVLREYYEKKLADAKAEFANLGEG